MKATHTLIVAALALGVAWTTPALAHCDALDGPVVNAAQRALATGKVEHALIWVRAGDETQVRSAFEKARKARASGKADDAAFFATLVRVHRAGEGERFTGLKPAGGIAAHVAAADDALASGTPEHVERIVVEDTLRSLRTRYVEARSRRDFDPSDVAGGRRYVTAYVDYVHHVERLHDAAAAQPHAHAAAADPHAHAAADGKGASRPSQDAASRHPQH
jgi:hypothetical protein